MSLYEVRVDGFPFGGGGYVKGSIIEMTDDQFAPYATTGEVLAFPIHADSILSYRNPTMVLYYATESVTVAGDTASGQVLIGAGIGSLVIPPGTLATGKILRIMAGGTLSLGLDPIALENLSPRITSDSNVATFSVGEVFAVTTCVGSLWQFSVLISIVAAGAPATILYNAGFAASGTTVTGVDLNPVMQGGEAINTTLANTVHLTTDGFSGSPTAADLITCDNFIVDLIPA